MANEQNLQQIQGQGFEMNNVVELQKILLAVNKLREELILTISFCKNVRMPKFILAAETCFSL